VSLEEYRNKRDFNRTPEPEQDRSKTKQKEQVWEVEQLNVRYHYLEGGDAVILAFMP